MRCHIVQTELFLSPHFLYLVINAPLMSKKLKESYDWRNLTAFWYYAWHLVEEHAILYGTEKEIILSGPMKVERALVEALRSQKLNIL